jgi:exodeoxyribonuclease VII small subunit
MPRRKANAEDPPSAATFEHALAELETIVEAMEHEQLPLEELVTHYERGTGLLDRCEAILHSARERIELITLRDKNAPESATEAPASGPAGLSLPSGPPDAHDDDDIRLF